jgi:cytochrome oxidase Cu insertion factor (SCO1/SenC/PrrC family)
LSKLLPLALIFGLAGAGCATAPAATARQHDAHARAPDFALTDTDGRTIALHDLLRRGPVILVFFPKAFTTG